MSRKILLKTWWNFTVTFTDEDLIPNKTITVEIINKFPKNIEIYPNFVEIASVQVKNWNYTFRIFPLNCGKFPVILSSSDRILGDISFDVIESNFLDGLSRCFGIIAYGALLLAVYPQLIENYSRKSTAGLSSDFVILNGFSAVVLFITTLALSLSPKNRVIFQSKYINFKPTFLHHFHHFHTLVASLLLIFQAVKLDKNHPPKYTKLSKIPLAAITMVLLYASLLIQPHTIQPADFYIICFTAAWITAIIKHLPQIMENHRRSSTDGWCVGNSIMEIVGSLFSIGRVILIEYNYGSWVNVRLYWSQFWLCLWIMGNHCVLIGQKLFYSKPRIEQAMPLHQYLSLYKEFG